jgi:autotransporter-associated beta strand protein
VFRSYYGHTPHIIICHLKRTKLDCNRSLAESGAGTNVYAVRAWNEFQDFINIASNSAVAQNGVGFYIDLHGQKHTRQRLELGYLLSASQLAKTDAVLDQPVYAAQSSIRTLASLVGKKTGLPFSQLLRGKKSFGGLMAAYGYPSVPSPEMPGPVGDELYFDGGYNVAAHSSHAGGGPVDGVQIEANMTHVRDSAGNRTNCSLALARTLDYFFTNYYGLDLRISAPRPWKGGAGKWATAANWGGVPPVAGNYLVFSGPGGQVDNNLPATTTGSGRVYSILFATNASGAYHLSGNPISLNAGVTNLSSHGQTIGNAITLLSAQTFSSSATPLRFTGDITNAGFSLSLAAMADLTINGEISGAGGLTKSGEGGLILAAANSFSGPVKQQAGWLLANNLTGSATGSGGVWVNQGASLGGTGIVGGPVCVSGKIAPGNPAGTLTITNGLEMEDGGRYCWTLATNTADEGRTNYGQLELQGGKLSLRPTTTLLISFTNCASAPVTNNPFWQTEHSWKIISLVSDATNVGAAKFDSIANATWPAGKFICSTDARGNVLLHFIPAPALLISPAPPKGGATHANIRFGIAAGAT